VGEPVKVALLQTNIEQSLKWRPEMLQRWLEVNLTMLRANPADSSCCPKPPSPADRPPAAGLPDELQRIAAAMAAT
jgi:apolipoprotein N-acyltransferase